MTCRPVTRGALASTKPQTPDSSSFPFPAPRPPLAGGTVQACASMSCSLASGSSRCWGGSGLVHWPIQPRPQGDVALWSCLISKIRG